MKAIVFSHAHGGSYVMDKEGCFRFVRGYSSAPVGAEIELLEVRANFTMTNLIKAASAAACFLIMISLGIFVFMWNNVDYAIYLEINPAVELQFNKLNRLKAANPLNEDGVELLEGLKLRGSPEEVIVALIKTAEQKGYLEDESDGAVLVAVAAAGGKPPEIYASTIVSALEKNGMIEYTTVEIIDNELRDRALELGVSPGKLKLTEKLLRLASGLYSAGSSDDPDIIITLEEAMAMSVKELTAAIREAEKASESLQSRMPDAPDTPDTPSVTEPAAEPATDPEPATEPEPEPDPDPEPTTAPPTDTGPEIMRTPATTEPPPEPPIPPTPPIPPVPPVPPTPPVPPVPPTLPIPPVSTAPVSTTAAAPQPVYTTATPTPPPPATEPTAAHTTETATEPVTEPTTEPALEPPETAEPETEPTIETDETEPAAPTRRRSATEPALEPEPTTEPLTTTEPTTAPIPTTTTTTSQPTETTQPQTTPTSQFIPTQPTQPTTNPTTNATEPPTTTPPPEDTTDPTEDPTDTTDPTEDPTDTTDPTEDPTDTTNPTEPTEGPTDPTEEPTEDPTNPTEEPTKPTEPTEPGTEPSSEDEPFEDSALKVTMSGVGIDRKVTISITDDSGKTYTETFPYENGTAFETYIINAGETQIFYTVYIVYQGNAVFSAVILPDDG